MIENAVHIIFSICLFASSLVFIPQAWSLYKTKDPRGVSLLMFLGFNITQLFTIWHAYYLKDYSLFWGTILIFASAVTVTFMLIYYRFRSGAASMTTRTP